MNQVFRPHIGKYIIVYFDDILVFSKIMEEHLKHIKLVPDILQIETLFINPAKVNYARIKLYFLEVSFQ